MALQLPIVIVPKKDGSSRMCIHSQYLNKVTTKNKYPLPRINEFLDQVQQAKIFTMLELKLGYHQVRVKEEALGRQHSR